jgi:5'-3' exonuclease
MKTYLLIDLANMYFRARHSAHRATSAEEKVAFAIHVTLSSVNKCWRDQRGDHVVFFNEGRSWRKDFYPAYKRNRAEGRAALTEKEAEEDRAFWEGLDALKDFLDTRTNCTVLRHPELEADDLISGWIQAHPNDMNIIVSTDSDFHQLLATNVKQYNGVMDELHTLEGIFDRRGKLVVDKKTKEPKVIPDPEWILFEKCMRGDPTDNVFSAYPGVRIKGSRNKVGLLEAYEDRGSRGFNWNNLMLQRWTDHEGREHRVLDDYNRNRILIDLKAQPDEIKAKIAETITQGSVERTRPMIGAQFLKFCGRFDLQKLSENSQNFAEIFSAAYKDKQ